MKRERKMDVCMVNMAFFRSLVLPISYKLIGVMMDKSEK